MRQPLAQPVQARVLPRPQATTESTLSTLDTAVPSPARDRPATGIEHGAVPGHAFSDPASAHRWLDDVPLVNVRAASSMLTTQLERFVKLSCDPETRYETLEVLRPALLTVQHEHAKRFRGKQLPLSPQRRQSLDEVSNLWDALLVGYWSCIDKTATGSEAERRLYAKMCHRSLDTLIRKMRDQQHAYLQVAPVDIAALHTLYGLAERAAIHRKRVRDPAIGAKEDAVSCERLYVIALLFDAATPREHRPLALQAIERWLERWAGKITVDTKPPAHCKVPPLWVNLMGADSVQRGAAPADDSLVRYLDVAELSHSLEKRIHALRRGARLEDIDLGVELSRRDLEVLVAGLHRQWCGGTTRRESERREINAVAHVSVGIQAAHFFLSKRPFEQPALEDAGEASTIAGPGEARIKAATEYMLMNGISAEQWVLRDESIGGMGLIRPRDEIESTRLGHGQLVSVRPRGGHTVTVGTIQWLQEAQDGDLHVGVKLVPGMPSPVAVRLEERAKFIAALMLPTVTALNAPTSLLLPLGTYALNRTLELVTNHREQVQLTGLLEVGADFERVAFVPMGRVDGTGSN